MNLIKKHFFSIAMVLVGSMIGALAFNLFIMPSKLVSGGVSGISLITSYVTGIKPGLLVMLINIPIFILGYKFVDREFIIYSLVGMIGFSFFLDAFSFMRGSVKVDDILLDCVFGGLLNGIGGGIVFRNRGSQGGSDIISVIVKKHFSMNIGTTLLAINIIIVISSMFIFKDVNKALYTLIMMFISSAVMDRVAQGFNVRKSIMIITDNHEDVARGIIDELGRGVTYLDGEGAYSGIGKRIIYCIINLNQLAKIKKIVFEIDDKAFMAVTDVAEVTGRGFAKKGI